MHREDRLVGIRHVLAHLWTNRSRILFRRRIAQPYRGCLIVVAPALIAPRRRRPEEVEFRAPCRPLPTIQRRRHGCAHRVTDENHVLQHGFRSKLQLELHMYRRVRERYGLRRGAAWAAPGFRRPVDILVRGRVRDLPRWLLHGAMRSSRPPRNPRSSDRETGFR